MTMDYFAVREFYSKFLPLYSNISSRFVGWRTKEEQDLRFSKLLAIGVENCDSILDWGCGVGDLKRYLDIRDIKCSYMGIDVLEEYICVARMKYPDIKVEQGSVEGIYSSYDWVLASGVFTIGVKQERFTQMVERAMSIARKGFAFNLLNAATFNKKPLISYRVEDIKKMLERHDIQIIEGYMEEDFTVYIRISKDSPELSR